MFLFLHRLIYCIREQQSSVKVQQQKQQLMKYKYRQQYQINLKSQNLKHKTNNSHNQSNSQHRIKFQQYRNRERMSTFQQLFQPFRNKPRVVINDKFIGDQGAHQLATFIQQHGRIQSLQIKSNEISSTGFIEIFNALISHNQQLRQLIIQYNNLGQNNYNDWQSILNKLLANCIRLQRLNISNNKITGESLRRIASQIAKNGCLKLLEMRYNNIGSADVDVLVGELKAVKNQALLYVELAGNKIKKEAIDSLQSVLKQNRSKNPISRDKLMQPTGSALVQPPATMNFPVDNPDTTNFLGSANTFYMNKTNAIDQLSRENVIKHLQDLLTQNRKDTAQMKVRLQKQLQELQRREKNDARELSELDRKCNQLMMANRNLKFQLQRTIGQHQQIQRDQDHNVRLHEQKLREANKQLLQLQNKYQQIQQRMCKQHESKMKQIAREWESRLRIIQDKIRQSENQNGVVDNEIRKCMEKKERLRVECLQQQSVIRNRVQDQQTQRYTFKLSALQIKLKQLQQTRQRYIRRNQQLLYDIQKTQSNYHQQITDLQDELSELRVKQEQFVQRNKDFLNRNEKLKSQINLKQITVQKLEEQCNRLNDQIESKKAFNREQVAKIVTDHAYNRVQKEEDKKAQIQKLNGLEATLRNAQLQNTKLRQEYAILAQRLQISLGQAVQTVFSENNFY